MSRSLCGDPTCAWPTVTHTVPKRLMHRQARMSKALLQKRVVISGESRLNLSRGQCQTMKNQTRKDVEIVMIESALIFAATFSDVQFLHPYALRLKHALTCLDSHIYGTAPATLQAQLFNPISPTPRPPPLSTHAAQRWRSARAPASRRGRGRPCSRRAAARRSCR